MTEPVNDAMWALCPTCGGAGCGKCLDGLRVLKAEGYTFVELCTVCGRDVGGCFRKSESDVPTDDEPCPFCNGKTVWKSSRELKESEA